MRLCKDSTKNWIFLILSGLATGASWLCYFEALRIGEASKVVSVDKLRHETITLKNAIGCILITIGTLLMVL